MGSLIPDEIPTDPERLPVLWARFQRRLDAEKRRRTPREWLVAELGLVDRATRGWLDWASIRLGTAARPTTFLSVGQRSERETLDDLRSGDLFLLGGEYGLSNVVTSYGVTPDKFSHVVMVHRDRDAGPVRLVEARESGLIVRELRPGRLAKMVPGCRRLLLRPRDPAIAERAATLLYDLAVSYGPRGGDPRHPRHNLPFNFGNDHTVMEDVWRSRLTRDDNPLDPTARGLRHRYRLNCVEAVRYAFKLAAGPDAPRVPIPMATISPEVPLLMAMGLSHPSYLPIDSLIVDPAFSVVAEWRALGRLRRSEIHAHWVRRTFAAARGRPLSPAWRLAAGAERAVKLSVRPLARLSPKIDCLPHLPVPFLSTAAAVLSTTRLQQLATTPARADRIARRHLDEARETIRAWESESPAAPKRPPVWFGITRKAG